MFFNSLISRVIILIILILALGVGTFSIFFTRREHNRLITSARENAELLLSTVEKSIYNSMLTGSSAEVQVTLEKVGRSHGLTNVRIFHPNGTILRSAHPEEIGNQVEAEELEMLTNHRSERVLHRNGTEVLSMVKPIVSDARCAPCHGAGRRIIGVLDLHLSLGETTRKLRQTTHFFMLSTMVILVVLSGGISFVLLRFVKRPIRMMADRMSQVEAGDLSVRLEPQSDDEMGSLMKSFNSMVVNLEKAQHELEQMHYRQMARADRLASIGEMSTGLAHEIKNPLAGISGAISVLADDFAEDDPRKEIVRQVLEQIGRLDKTATDLLSFGRPGKPEFDYLDINSLVKKTLFFIAQHPEAKNIHRVMELTRELPLVWADEKQIQQVLFNIIINGIQSMKEGGTLLIHTELIGQEDGRQIRVRIADTGKGIAPEELDRIFIPFHTTKTQGTGLGLPISRQLIEQHGGSIHVDSRVGEGTTFSIDLPLAAEQLEDEVKSA